MIVLGIEGARLPAGVALLQVDEEEGSVQVGALALVEKGPNASDSVSGSLLLAIEAALEHAQSTLEEVGALAVGIGPGSWTGLRVTLSLVKTLAQARNIAIVGVPSFDALAQAVWRAGGAQPGDEPSPSRAHRMLLVVGECRPGELYAKLFESCEDYLAAAQDEWIAAPASLLDSLWTQALARGIEAPPLIVCAQGDSAASAMRQVCQEQDEAAQFASVDAIGAALEVALAALERLAEGEADDPLSLAPLYLAPSAAERVRFGL